MKKRLKCLWILLVLIFVVAIFSGCTKKVWYEEDYWVGVYSATETITFADEDIKYYSPTGKKVVEYNIIVVLREDRTFSFSLAIDGVFRVNKQEGKWGIEASIDFLDSGDSPSGDRYRRHMYLKVHEGEKLTSIHSWEKLGITSKGDMYYYFSISGIRFGINLHKTTE